MCSTRWVRIQKSDGLTVPDKAPQTALLSGAGARVTAMRPIWLDVWHTILLKTGSITCNICRAIQARQFSRLGLFPIRCDAGFESHFRER